jgi:hypothetical protein
VGYGAHVTEQTNVNPSPLLLENGTIIIVYTDASDGEQIALASADEPEVGRYPIVTLQYISTDLYQISYHIR